MNGNKAPRNQGWEPAAKAKVNKDKVHSPAIAQCFVAVLLRETVILRGHVLEKKEGFVSGNALMPNVK